MNRRQLLQSLTTLSLLPLLTTRVGAQSGTAASTSASASVDDAAIVPLTKAHEAWRDEVSPAAYRVLFEEHTESAFSSPLDKEKRAGTYLCAACYLPLFSSSDKFDSGTGWPSFIRPIAGHIGTRRDFALIWPRTEYHCIRCGGHQGHVFDDGPPPTHQRWCNNGVALRFVPQGEALPELRS